MADHLRKQIRMAAAAALTGLGTTGAHVYPSRTEDLEDANLPALRVYTRNEEVVGKTAGNNPIYDRLLELLVEGVVKADAALDDTMDQIAKEVEQALAANQGIGGAKFVFLSHTEIDMESEGERDRGLIMMTFNVNYHAAAGSPDVAL